MKTRGVRGATTVAANTREAIAEATQELLKAIIEMNGIDEDDVASVLFTTSPDLTAAYPASFAREVGWTRTALMGFQEMDVPGGLGFCLRILVHWNTEKGLDDIVHVYLRGATKLRPDLSQSPPSNQAINHKK